MFTIALKEQSILVPAGDWFRLELDLGEWLRDGYAVLEAQLYAEPWAEWDGPTDLRTRLQREPADGEVDVTAESVHAVANDWAIARSTLMHCRADTPVALTIRARGAPITLHTVIYRGVELEGDPGSRDAEWIEALTSGSAWPVVD